MKEGWKFIARKTPYLPVLVFLVRGRVMIHFITDLNRDSPAEIFVSDSTVHKRKTLSVLVFVSCMMDSCGSAGFLIGTFARVCIGVFFYCVCIYRLMLRV